MMRSLRHLCATGLAAYLLLFGALAYPETVAHAAHHAHHHAATHSTAGCAWLCAAGQGIEHQGAVLTVHVLSSGLPPIFPLEPTEHSPPSLLPARGPPPL